MSPEEDRAFVSNYALAAREMGAAFAKHWARLRAELAEAQKEVSACRKEIERLRALRSSAGLGGVSGSRQPANGNISDAAPHGWPSA